MLSYNGWVRWGALLGLLGFLALSPELCAQQALAPVPAQSPPGAPAPQGDPPPITPQQGCVEPEPILSLDEYNGPLKKTAAFLSRKFERTTVHHPHWRAGAVICSLSAREKFVLFVRDTAEPLSFIVAGFNAGISQARDHDAAFGQGAAGYGKRYAAAYADIASDNFFKRFLYPAIFHEDPRYYRMKHGRTGARVWHAMRHTFVAQRDSGKEMFNFSEWLGTASSVSVGNLYHPDNRRGFGPAAESTAIGVTIDMGLDVVREFLPDMFQKFKIPSLRREPDATNHKAAQNFK